MAEVKREIQARCTDAGAASQHAPMRRIPYRIVLPVIQLALYLVLIWYGCCNRPLWWQLHPRWEEIGDDWCTGYRSIAEQVAIGINMPAELVLALILAPFDSRFDNWAPREFAEHIATALLIPVFWFFIAKGLEPRRTIPANHSAVRKASAFVALVVVALVATVATGSLVRHIEYEPVLHALILAWGIGGIVVSVRQIRYGRVRVATN